MERVPKENRETAKRVTQEKSAKNSAQGDIAARLNNSPHMIAQRKKLQSLFGGAAQLKGAEDEVRQGKFETAQRAGEEELLQKKNALGEEEFLPGKFGAQQHKSAEEEPLQGKFEAAQRVAEEEPIQHKLASDSPAQLAPAEKKPNNTGLPDNLKSGIENLSGMSMDNVKVHYNSSQPAQLNALAYAQGTDIHVAPGQEQHLPHEAWHVVQQAQGRVQPTMQMKGGVPVNDDKGLEHEADVMGGKAVQMRSEFTDKREHQLKKIIPLPLLTQKQSPTTQLNGEGNGSLLLWGLTGIGAAIAAYFAYKNRQAILDHVDRNKWAYLTGVVFAVGIYWKKKEISDFISSKTDDFIKDKITDGIKSKLPDCEFLQNLGVSTVGFVSRVAYSVCEALKGYTGDENLFQEKVRELVSDAVGEKLKGVLLPEAFTNKIADYITSLILPRIIEQLKAL